MIAMSEVEYQEFSPDFQLKKSQLDYQLQAQLQRRYTGIFQSYRKLLSLRISRTRLSGSVNYCSKHCSLEFIVVSPAWKIFAGMGLMIAKPVHQHGFVCYSNEENNIWSLLLQRQTAILQDRACNEYLHGLELLKLPADRIPQYAELNLYSLSMHAILASSGVID
jgi:hypothetical protein